MPLLGDTEQKGLLGVQGRPKKVGVILPVQGLGVHGLPKKGLPFLVSDKRLTGDGVKRTAKRKKAERLQVYLLTLDIVGTHVPCLVYAVV